MELEGVDLVLKGDLSPLQLGDLGGCALCLLVEVPALLVVEGVLLVELSLVGVLHAL